MKDRVTDYRRDFAGTAYEETILAELLDMSSGVGDLEVWDVPDSCIKRFERAVMGGGDVAGRSSARRRARRRPASASTTRRSTPRSLGWVLEAATGRSLARYAAERLWSRIGAERDAYYWLTRAHPRTAIGGRLVQRDRPRRRPARPADGQRRRRSTASRSCPATGCAAAAAATSPQLAVGALGPSGYDHYGYANQWWTLGGELLDAFTGLGRPRPVPVRRPERRRRDRQVQRLAHPGRRTPRPGDHHRPAHGSPTTSPDSRRPPNSFRNFHRAPPCPKAPRKGFIDELCSPAAARRQMGRRHSGGCCSALPACFSPAVPQPRPTRPAPFSPPHRRRCRRSCRALATGKRIPTSPPLSTVPPPRATGLVLTPKTGKKNQTVVWGHGTTGLADQCAPSASQAVFWPEARAAIAALLAQGLDRGGPRLSGARHADRTSVPDRGSEGRSMIDSVKAARNLDSALTTKYALDGHSQGGQGALFAGQLAPSYDGALVLRGVAAIAPVSNVDLLAPRKSPEPRARATW